MKTRPELERIATAIVDSAIQVHRALGPGLLESAYQRCLTYELTSLGFRVDREVMLPLAYKGLKLNAGYRIDMLIEQSVIVENKVADQLLPIHEAQLLTYMKLTGVVWDSC